MISSALKPAVTRLINPLARAVLRVGLTPNSVTILGALGLIISAAYFYSKEEYFVGTLVITVFALSDLFDGAMARISDEGATSWGGFLDSTIDRVTDSAIVISLALPLIREEDLLAYPAVVALVTGVLIPYIRAKAESFNIACSVGITERTERLVIILVAAGFHGLGVPYILAIGIWTLAVLGLVTVFQRLQVVRKGLADS
ncbi:CDP-diacylglycerol--glycerol-3-phosphate 3-phosphatidyltransferase [Candidatus Planktophila versatilis]|uniref:CDP-diacylglycerol--glycerol-3-phosphate 3-phosphatidyltransferase n=1 Tax=Candidatus Planktophila versatilis TaxID=1884905 RepID=A0AAC9YWX1_9ACTN|nr:CDP-alcohol phosphatidyltransferase family protein [Candidatus Planktophila versatilis]ASY19270.1 CDP-diacylglycerol--glycerol-3-phosphate 3-phosphatidyltransferase [Candidatus Planktophila versatilis]ASY23281.1 CDP-diacylglycerol--glycerol-3-phosphate 3-phosphatidyltransferase [Candidatus Planktophila versatilis]